MAQTKVRPTPEPCQVSQPPTFRGFYLGQTPKQIEVLIPGFQEAYDEAAREATGPARESEAQESPEPARESTGAARESTKPAPESTGPAQIIVSSTSLFSKEGERKPPREAYEDVDYIWHFFAGKLFYLIVKYNEFEPPSVQDFVKQAAPRLNLPLTGWSFTTKNHATLNCHGFMIELWAGNLPGESFDQDVATIMVTDSVVKAELDRRLKQETDKEKRLQEERIRQQRDRKRIFKP